MGDQGQREGDGDFAGRRSDRDASVAPFSLVLTLLLRLLLLLFGGHIWGCVRE